VAHALQHATIARAQREDVTAVPEVRRNGRRIHGDANRRRAILRADARRHAKSRRRVDGGDVRRPVAIEVRFGDRRQPQRVDPVAREREADHPAAALVHKIDHRRRDKLRGANQIPFVLAILVVRDDDELAVADGADRLFYRSESHVDSLSKRCTYFPNISASTCT